MRYILSYDLGTGGTKAALYDETGRMRAAAFVSCRTYYPQVGYYEQRPAEWWDSVVLSTRKLIEESGVSPAEIYCLSTSGHSCGVVPIGRDGGLVADRTPIWSDTRAVEEADAFFKTVNERAWYNTTGGGFPPYLYAIFKIMWMKKHRPSEYDRTRMYIGTKDYIHYRMTGVLCTDPSNASGSGVYALRDEEYVDAYIRASGIESDRLPPIVPSTAVLGTLSPAAAQDLGLPRTVRVVCGGVDNACMALGAGCIGDGEAYTSLGTSAWIAVSGHEPIVDFEKKPYVFAHCVPHMMVSSTAIFAAGNAFRWVKETLCRNLVRDEESGLYDAYRRMDELAAASPIGANRLLFIPSLAGGSGLDRTSHVRGCFLGLDLSHTQSDLIRATLEGVCLNLRMALDALESHTPTGSAMLLVGGGGKSPFWRQMFADVYNKAILETPAGEEAGSLGAAVVAAVGCGLWSFDKVRELLPVTGRLDPQPVNAEAYRRLLPLFAFATEQQWDLSDVWRNLAQFVCSSNVKG